MCWLHTLSRFQGKYTENFIGLYGLEQGAEQVAVVLNGHTAIL